MAEAYTARFPPLECPFWSWKLDPFQTADSVPDITVSYCPGKVKSVGTSVWRDDAAGRQMYLQDDGTLLWQQTEPEQTKLLLQFGISQDWSRITLLADNSATVGMAAFESLTFLIYYAFLHRQVLTFHGAVVEADGKCFLLCADSGVGKTTHARLWRDHKNALILNGDRAACYQQGNRWFAFGTPWCGTSGEYLNRSAAVQAVVILERGKENRVSMTNGMSLLPYVEYFCTILFYNTRISGEGHCTIFLGAPDSSSKPHSKEPFHIYSP